jgi:hypothetical protein
MEAERNLAHRHRPRRRWAIAAQSFDGAGNAGFVVGVDRDAHHHLHADSHGAPRLLPTVAVHAPSAGWMTRASCSARDSDVEV